MKLSRSLLPACAAGSAAFGAMAQAWPNRPVRIVVPYAAGSGTDMAVLKQGSGAPIVGIPYKSSPIAVTDVIGGHVQLLVDSVSATRPQGPGGKPKPLGVTSLRSTEAMPGVKSIAEQGYPGLEVTTWNVLFAPMLQLGLEPDSEMAPERIAQFIGEEIERWGVFVKNAGMRAE